MTSSSGWITSFVACSCSCVGGGGGGCMTRGSFCGPGRGIGFPGKFLVWSLFWNNRGRTTATGVSTSSAFLGRQQPQQRILGQCPPPATKPKFFTATTTTTATAAKPLLFLRYNGSGGPTTTTTRIGALHTRLHQFSYSSSSARLFYHTLLTSNEENDEYFTASPNMVAATTIPPAVPVIGLTENLAKTYWATGSYCLDLFFDTVPGIDSARLEELLAKSWNEDPLLTIKLIFQLGDPRWGKRDRRNFYVALQWLYQHHPDSLFINLVYIPRFSCYKALLDLLELVCCGSDALDDKRQKRTNSTNKKAHKLVNLFFQDEEHSDFLQKHGYTLSNSLTIESLRGNKRKGKKTILIWKNENVRTAYSSFVKWHVQQEIKKAREQKIFRRDHMQNHANNKLKTDDKYRRLWEAVADIFSANLLTEKKKLEEHPEKSLSGLAAKWAPSVNQSHDRHTLIVDGIVERMYPPEIYQLPEGTREDYLSFARDWYRKEVAKQRGAAQIPEHFIGGGLWHLVNYNRMPSLCRHMHGHIYKGHDEERYNQYLEEAKDEAKAVLKMQEDNQDASLSNKIKAGTLLPHEIVGRALAASNTGDTDESNLQWLQLVQDTRKAGRIPMAISICDVSGSMIGTPMEVAIALSLLVADSTPPHSPWRGKIIPFSEVPTLVTLPAPTTDNLAERAREARGIDMGYNTDFQAVFDLILNNAKFWNIPDSAMPTVLFCFSDMEFDEANHRYGDDICWSTDYEQIQKKYEQAGYTLPHIVFWNLRPSSSKPTIATEKGVTMLSGFSAGLLKSFLAGQFEDFTPYGQMVQALRRYECLQVVAPPPEDASEVEQSQVHLNTQGSTNIEIKSEA